MIRKYGSHPFFVAKIADKLESYGVASVAERMYREVWVHPLTNAGRLGRHLNPLVGQEMLGRAWY